LKKKENTDACKITIIILWFSFCTSAYLQRRPGNLLPSTSSGQAPFDKLRAGLFDKLRAGSGQRTREALQQVPTFEKLVYGSANDHPPKTIFGLKRSA